MDCHFEEGKFKVRVNTVMALSNEKSTGYVLHFYLSQLEADKSHTLGIRTITSRR